MDLKMAAAILFSGNNFHKIKLLSKMLSLHMIQITILSSRSAEYKRKILHPTLDGKIGMILNYKYFLNLKFLEEYEEN